MRNDEPQTAEVALPSGDQLPRSARLLAEARRLIGDLPGVTSVSRYLRRHYTGHEGPEPFLRGHFYSPLPDLGEVRARARELFHAEVADVPGIDLRQEEQAALLRRLARYAPDFDWPDEPRADRRFHLGQGHFSHGDAYALYALLRDLAPSHVVEVGSGHSSALMLDVAELHLGGNVGFTFVEPYPDRLFSVLRPADHERCDIRRERVQDTPREVFDRLSEGDVLFVDSSHVSKVGSDVNRLIFEVLPALPSGVVVHFHDIWWPFEYPEHWVLRGTAWNEAYLLRAFLQYNDAFEILLFSSFAVARLDDLIREHLPMFAAGAPGSIWLRKR